MIFEGSAEDIETTEDSENTENIEIKDEHVSSLIDNTDISEDKEDTDREYEANASLAMTDNLYSEYIKDISKFPLLTPTEEIEVAKRMKNGDREARETMINCNLKLVVSNANSYRVSGVDIMDLIQEGNQGLMTAVDKFDVDRGYKFSTYATWWIKQGILRYIMNCGRTIRIPVHALELNHKIDKCRKELSQTLYREPTTAEIADKLALDESKVIHILNVTADIKSLDATVHTEDGHDESLLGEFIADTSILSAEEQYNNVELHNAIMQILFEKKHDGKYKFSDRERDIILKRFGFYGGEYTLDRLGKEYSITRERIRQIEARVLRKLRLPSSSRILKEFLNK